MKLLCKATAIGASNAEFWSVVEEKSVEIESNELGLSHFDLVLEMQKNPAAKEIMIEFFPLEPHNSIYQDASLPFFSLETKRPRGWRQSINFQVKTWINDILLQPAK